jgi:hypothetical protein
VAPGKLRARDRGARAVHGAPSRALGTLRAWRSGSRSSRGTRCAEPRARDIARVALGIAERARTRCAEPRARDIARVGVRDRGARADTVRRAARSGHRAHGRPRSRSSRGTWGCRAARSVNRRASSSARERSGSAVGARAPPRSVSGDHRVMRSCDRRVVPVRQRVDATEGPWLASYALRDAIADRGLAVDATGMPTWALAIAGRYRGGWGIGRR